MKLFFAFALVLISLVGLAQEPSDSIKERQDIGTAFVERIPVAQGCNVIDPSDQAAMKLCMQQYIYSHIGSNFKYPKKARQQAIQAKIIVQFVIEKDASMSNVTIKKGAADLYKDAKPKVLAAAQELDAEAIRVIELLKFEMPATQRSKPVRFTFTVPINAKLT